MEPMATHTPRLTLVPANAVLLRAEMAGRELFGRTLGATIPSGWPPPLYERSNIQWTLTELDRDPDLEGWLTWIWLRKTETLPVAIGMGGLKGKPDNAGAVEIGYMVLPEFQNQGFATEAVGALVEWAFAHAEVMQVIAETLPELPASVRVLRKCGFEFVGNGSDIEVLRFERKRAKR